MVFPPSWLTNQIVQRNKEMSPFVHENGPLWVWGPNIPKKKLERLGRLRSEDTLRRLMITHSIESYWIPSQKKTKSKLQI